MTLREYTSEAINRIRSGEVSSQNGSHLAGIFGKAAQEFEGEIRQFLYRELQASNLSYEKEFQHLIPGRPTFTKLTLGQIVHCLENLDPAPQKGSTLEVLSSRASLINKSWVSVKHGDGIDEQSCIERLEMVLVCLDLVEK